MYRIRNERCATQQHCRLVWIDCTYPTKELSFSLQLPPKTQHYYHNSTQFFVLIRAAWSRTFDSHYYLSRTPHSRMFEKRFASELDANNMRLRGSLTLSFRNTSYDAYDLLLLQSYPTFKRFRSQQSGSIVSFANHNIVRSTVRMVFWDLNVQVCSAKYRAKRGNY